MCRENDIPIPISYIGYDKDFFESNERIIKFPTLMAKTKEVDNLIVDWQNEYRKKRSQK